MGHVPAKPNVSAQRRESSSGWNALLDLPGIDLHIEQTTNHSLVGGVVAFCDILEKLNAPPTQRNSHLYAFLPEHQLILPAVHHQSDCSLAVHLTGTVTKLSPP